MYNNSDSTIYHFTKNIESLISILDKGFYPHICEEDMSIVLPNYDNMTVGIPMVCFTDIPLVQSEKHRKEYGFYGIGLNKKWAIENGLAPISYFIKDTTSWKLYNYIQKAVVTTYEELIKEEQKNKISKCNEYVDRFEGIIKAFIEYSGYIKPYSSDIFNSSVKPFYEENEWRYTPPFVNSSCCKISNWLINEDITSKNITSLNNRMKKEYTLKFKETDVTEIILPDEKDKRIFLKNMPQYESKMTIVSN